MISPQLKSPEAGVFLRRPVPIDAYRVFFPIGWLMGLAGVGLWILFLQNAMGTYPKEWHADLMTGGFLPLFAAGFLMTAVPRFTGSFGPERSDFVVGGALAAGLLLTVFFPNRLPFHACLGAFSLFLLAFCWRRIRNRSAYPPPPLILALAALAAEVVAAAFQAFHDATGRADLFDTLGRLYLYEGFQLLLILGVGIFLIPNLLGRPTCTPPVTVSVRPPKEKPLPFLRLIPLPLWVVSAVLLASFALEIRVSPALGRGLRAAVFTLVSFHDWKIHRGPAVRSTLAWSLWTSCWLLLLGLWLPVAAPSYDVHARHLAYVGGFGLMTFAVATRVTLAHGSHDLVLEKTSRLLKAAVGLILLAAATRSIARLLPETAYWNHLLFAAWSWTLGLAAWGGFALPRIFKTGD
ncbi:MAG TPA: NnrS family protein [bacterium]|nr:NnrS family protein [bacterium]